MENVSTASITVDEFSLTEWSSLLQKWLFLMWSFIPKGKKDEKIREKIVNEQMREFNRSWFRE